jgi:ABC-type arginine/histidine transport system permease subunit
MIINIDIEIFFPKVFESAIKRTNNEILVKSKAGSLTAIFASIFNFQHNAENIEYKK